MRTRMMVLAAVLGSVAVVGGVAAGGCSNLADNCYERRECCPDGTLSCFISSSAGGHDGGTSTGGTGTGGHVNCDPVLGAVDGSCGVFVSSSRGDDGNAGTQGKPLKTIGAAVMKAGAGRVYACGENFTEAVTVSAGVALYGALECSKGWAYHTTKKTVLTAAKNAIPLTLASTATGAEVMDFKIVAADAMASGGSSIAVVADHATATLTRCDLLAGAAKDGDPGTSGGVPAMQAAPGLPGDNAGTTGTSKGGIGGTNLTCNLLGGDGGNGGPIASGDGVDGNVGDSNQGGAKGTGQTSTAACTNGANGALGGAGPAGPVMAGIGTIDKSGYHGIDGQPGVNGGNGASGGGGGGSRATTTAHGAGGGGGGAGGCGGMLGTGGKAAGSSIALLSIGATVTLASCSLGSGKAGNGGAGGDGQPGQPGGQQGNGGAAATPAAGCNGGTGGKGGNGGDGSGGLGGHSLGIASTGTAPMLDAATQKAVTPGTKGTGGLGGNMDASMNHGADGTAAACWDFGMNMACK